MVKYIHKKSPFNCNLLIVFLIFQLSFSYLFSQTITFKYGEFDLNNKYEDFLNEELRELSIGQTNYYKIIRFVSIPNREIRNEIESKGISFLEYLSENSYIVSIPNNFLKSNLDSFSITHVQDIPKILRFDPAIFESPIPLWADINDKIKLEIILMKNFDSNLFLKYLDD